jgi:hypothetical protein
MIRGLKDITVEYLTSECVLCSSEKGNVQEYFENAFCEGDEIVYQLYPTMQCGDCTARIAQSLSDETLEIRRDFFHRHFGLPPDGHAVEPAEIEMLFTI